MFALLSFIFLLIVFVYIKSPRLSKNEPPLVPYTIPVIGHTYSYIFDTERFFRKCIKEYGEPFNLLVFGKVVTVVARKHIPEIFRAHESFNTLEVVKELMPLHLIFETHPYNKDFFTFFAKTIKEQISGKLVSHFDNIQKDILYSFDKWIGECDEPKNIKKVWDLTNRISAKTIATICIGEEGSQHDDVIHTCSVFADEMNRIFFLPPILSIIHQKLHEYIISLPFLIGFNPATKHKRILINRIKPIIEKRIQLKKTLGDQYKPSNDLLEFFMSRPDFDSSNVNYSYLADFLTLIIILGIGTTGRSSANLLFDYANGPEYWDELYEEVSRIDKESNGKLTIEDTNKMIKLDSFVRESLRHTNDIIITPHAVTADHYTFSSGYTIPKGRHVYDFSDDCLFSESAYGPDPKSFKPFQFINVPATKVDRSYVIFGGGRHACPGRFAAVNTMKLLLYNIILKYHVRSESGSPAKKVMIGPFSFPPKGTLVFEQRKK